MKIAFATQALIRACLVFMAFAPIGSQALNAQEQTTEQPRETQIGAQQPSRTAKATRVDRPPKLDGTLNDAVWQSATPIGNFLQREPFEGQSPTEKTEVRILYDKHNVYFGVICLDANPGGIIAT